MMENEIGSIIGYCYAKNPVTVYENDIPQGHKAPSMYFPAPISTSEVFTSSTFQKTYQLMVKVFEKNSKKAWKEAEGIADSIRLAKWLIPLIDEDGVRIDGRYVVVKNVNVRMLDHGEDGHMATAQLTIEWDSRYNYNQATYEKIGQVFFRYEAN
jgi:hypothetical protein